MKGWLDKYNDGGPVQKNYNDYSVSAPEGFVGDGYSNVGRNYSPAWGGQFAMGGSMPGSVGFMYARTNDPAPSKGKYAKKTMASAEKGTELGKDNGYVRIPSKKELEIINSAKSDITNEGVSPFRLNMLKDAVKHDMSTEQFKPLNEIDNNELNKRTAQLALKKQNNIRNAGVDFVQNNGILNNNNTVYGYYNPTDNNKKISLSNNINNITNTTERNNEFANTARHEFRHVYDDAGKLLTNYEKDIIKNKTATGDVDKIKAIGKNRYNYLSDPTEVTARLQEIRGGLKDAKVYDASKDKATLQHLNSANNISGYKDLLEVMKPEDIVTLLNTIAANNPQQGMPVAENGTEMEYYQNGLDWKPRSMAKGGNLYAGKDPKKFDKNVAKSDETKKSPAINYRSTADSERIAREKEVARRQTSVSAYDQKGMSPEVRKSVGEAMENQRVYDERIRKFADATQILGAGLEVAAPFTGPAAPALGAIGAGLGAGSSAYLAGKDAMAGDYKSALTNAAFGGLDVAGFSAIRNMGLKNAVSAADQVSDFGQVTDPSQLENLNIFTGKAPKGSLSSLLGEVKGRFNPKAKQSIEEGNQWLQDWVNHPATQQKIDDIFDSNFGLNTMSNLSREAYDRLKNYIPNGKAYPLKSQAKDFLDLRSKGYASKEGYPTMIHQGNRGVSYTHHRMPSAKPDHERFGNWTSLSPDMNEIERASTTIHEGTHDWLRQSTLNVLGYDTDVLQSLDPNVQRVVLQKRQLEQAGNSQDDIRRIMGENDYAITYYANPAEVHARTMEIRNAFGIKPDQKITANDWEHIRLNGPRKANQISPFHFKMFDSNQSAADVMNRLLVAPAAVGVGAAAMANQPEMKQGGQLTKLDQLTNFTNYNTKQPGGWLDKYEG
jgi:hypothetical protein